MSDYKKQYFVNKIDGYSLLSVEYLEVEIILTSIP